MRTAEYPSWLILPESRLSLRLDSHNRLRPRLEVAGNARGIVSLANIFLWLSRLARQHDFLSVSGLPFVAAEPGLVLYVALQLAEETECQGRLVRLDKDRQYEWQIHDDKLHSAACAIHSAACHPQGDYYDIPVEPASEAELIFSVTEPEP